MSTSFGLDRHDRRSGQRPHPCSRGGGPYGSPHNSVKGVHRGRRAGKQVEIRHNPGFAVGRWLLAPNEPLRAESGAMAAMAPDVALAGRKPSWTS